jgi:hypothetical protein
MTSSWSVIHFHREVFTEGLWTITEEVWPFRTSG